VVVGLSFAVIGTGAVGGYYGALLQRAGYDVHFLVRSDYDHVRRHGLQVDSKNGDFVLPEVNAYSQARDMPRCDVVIVCLKSYDNVVLPEILPHVVRDEGCVLLLQNGLGAERSIQVIVPQCTVLGGLSFLCSNKVGPGHIHHLDYGRIAIGEFSTDGEPVGVTETMQVVGRAFKKADVPISLLEDLMLARWMKLVWNVPFNGLCVVLNTTTDKLMANTATRALSRELMDEVVAGAAALGRTIPSPFVEKMINDTVKMASYNPSMKLDYDAGRRMEIEAIYGEPLRMAREAGADMPKVRMLYQLLGFLGGQNKETAEKAERESLNRR